jgi:hypothetical protein
MLMHMKVSRIDQHLDRERPDAASEVKTSKIIRQQADPSRGSLP